MAGQGRAGPGRARQGSLCWAGRAEPSRALGILFGRDSRVSGATDRAWHGMACLWSSELLGRECAALGRTGMWAELTTLHSVFKLPATFTWFTAVVNVLEWLRGTEW